jgi:hypothetical protein
MVTHFTHFKKVAVLDPKFELKGTGTTFLMFSQSTSPTGSGVFSIRRETLRYLWKFFAPTLLDEKKSSNVHRSSRLSFSTLAQE